MGGSPQVKERALCPKHKYALVYRRGNFFTTTRDDGSPVVKEDWSYHEDTNALQHACRLCPLLNLCSENVRDEADEGGLLYDVWSCYDNRLHGWADWESRREEANAWPFWVPLTQLTEMGIRSVGVLQALGVNAFLAVDEERGVGCRVIVSTARDQEFVEAVLARERPRAKLNKSETSADPSP